MTNATPHPGHPPHSVTPHLPDTPWGSGHEAGVPSWWVSGRPLRSGLQPLATASLTREFLPDLLASGKGALVNVASNTGYQSVPGMAVHAAAKSFILHFTEAVGYEVRANPLVVLALSPGATKTDFFATAGDIKGSPTGLSTPQGVVRTCLKALDRHNPPPSVVPGFANAVMARLVGFLPRRWALAAAGKVTGS